MFICSFPRYRTQKETAPTIKVKSEPKSNRSDLHLLYPQGVAGVEGSVPEARLLRSAGAGLGAAGDEDEGDEEDDVDYAPGEDEWRKTIMIGSDYQVPVVSRVLPCETQ